MSSQQNVTAYILSADDIDEALRIWSLAFDRGSRNLDHWRRSYENAPGGTLACGVRDESGLQSVLLILGYHCYFGAESVVPMGGIGVVASLPASRGRGYAGACLDFCLTRMRESGQAISMLGPFSFDYYRAYGWEWVGCERQYSVPSLVLKASEETERVRDARAADHPAIQSAYERFARRYRAPLVRSAAQWTDMLADTESQYTCTYVYDGNEGVEGYLTYRMDGRDKTGLREFVALTPRAQAGLLGLLRRQAMQINRFTWKAPVDDTLWSQFYHWDIETKLQPVMMGRVVDVGAAFEAWKPPRTISGTVRLAVRDPHAPWNEQTWQVECEEGRISAKKASAEPQVSLDIQALSQAYFGGPGAAHLRAAGRLTVHDEAGFSALCAILDGPPTWLNDFF